MTESKWEEYVEQHPNIKYFFTGGKGGARDPVRLYSAG